MGINFADIYGFLGYAWKWCQNLSSGSIRQRRTSLCAGLRRPILEIFPIWMLVPIYLIDMERPERRIKMLKEFKELPGKMTVTEEKQGEK
jgi:hypothetical protein